MTRSNNIVQFPSGREVNSKKNSFLKELIGLKDEDSSLLTAYINENIKQVCPVNEFEIDVHFSRDLFQIYFIGDFPGSPLVIQSSCVKSGLYCGIEKVMKLMESKGRVMMAALRPIYTDPLPMFEN